MQFNTNPETGIRYTVYSMNSIDPDIQHSLWYEHGKNLDEEAAYKEELAKALQAAEYEAKDAGEDFDPIDFEMGWECPELYIEEPHIEGEYQGVKYGISWLGGAPNLWVWESPSTKTFGLCSPCCPNACNAETPGDYEGYAVPADWLYKEVV